MTDSGISTQKVAYSLIIVVVVIYVAVIGKAIIAPVCFASLFALLLSPMCNYFDRKTNNKILSILITCILAILPVSVIIAMFTLQFIDILKDVALLRENFVDVVLDQLTLLEAKLSLNIDDTRQWLVENLSGIINAPISFAVESIGTSTYILTSVILTAIFTFMMLLYRGSAKQFFKIQFPTSTREEASQTMKEIRELTQSYLYGIIVVMIILAICNSLGLLLIGIDYAVFWGCLAAFLALVPYIGTFIGGLIPLLFAIITTDTLWQPVAVFALFSIIQFVEGNFITPKIVGKSVSINPLVAIIVLIVGGMIWGIAGMVLAIPVFGVLNTVMATLDPFKPLSLLFSNRVSDGEREFVEKYDEDRFRLSNFFSSSVEDKRDKSGR